MENVTKVITGKVRLSFVNLFVAKPDSNGKMKYGCQVLLPKTDTVTKAKLDAAIEEAKKQGVSSKWGGSMPPIIATPIHDGDGVMPVSGEEYGPECKGHWVFSASAFENYPPEVVDAQVNKILDQSEIYSGVYAIISVNLYPYSSSGKKGIAVSLNNVQKIANGEPLAGKKPASADFKPIELDPITGEPITD